MVEIRVNGKGLRVQEGITVAAALVNADVWRFRRSVNGEPRGPVCGMGICQECRVTIDGIRHRRACLEPVMQDMDVRTDD